MIACRKLILKLIVILVTWCLFCNEETQAQDNAVVDHAKEVLRERGELIIRFVYSGYPHITELSEVMSIDRISGDSITAYVNKQEFTHFLRLNIPFNIIPPPSLREGIFSPYKAVPGDWRTRYLSYPGYLELMDSLVTAHPDICELHEFGTSVGGRKLLALKITDNPGLKEQEPAFMYSSTMHGDEVLGYVLMLRFADYLLSNYNTDHDIKDLVDMTEIWINPLANPDGTYYMSDASVAGARRSNLNYVDLNRDFPDVREDLLFGSRQPETTAMMSLMSQIHLVLSANFHGGAEVVNYPWDTWPELHADDEWYRYISRSYADTVHKYAPAGYLDDLDDGITNGYAWYVLYGGRQDYANYYLHSREVTIELSSVKMPAESTLDDYWLYNRQSLLQYLMQVRTGIKGIVTDSLTGQPLDALIALDGQDKKNSEIISQAEDGWYYRLLQQGDYDVTVSKPGYTAKSVIANVISGTLTQLNVRLSPVISKKIFPNPFSDVLYIYLDEAGYDLTIEFTDLMGRVVKKNIIKEVTTGVQEISTRDLSSAIYIVRILYNKSVFQQVMVKGNR